MIYLDHAATTPPRPGARAVMARWLDPEQRLGNASSAHAAGRRARQVVEEAREQVAATVGAHANDVVFTSGGTEADNLAVLGLARAGAERGRRHVVTTAVEHPAVLDACRWLAEHEGFALDIVGPSPDGRVDPEEVLDRVRDDTALVAVMAANNELGAVNDLGTIGTALRDRGVPFHVDAVQAFATLDVDQGAWQADTMALSAHKFGGPGGVGVAVLRRGVPVVPASHGGGQDRGVRSGSFAAALDAACAAAAEAAAAERAELRTRLRTMTDGLAGTLRQAGGVRRNGPADPGERLASHLHLSIDGVDGEALLFALDRAGVCASTGSACHAGANRASHVLIATGLDATASLRLSLGWTSAEEEIVDAAGRITDVIGALRAVGGGAVA